MILQEGDGVAVIPTLAKKFTSELAEVMLGHVIWGLVRSYAKGRPIIYEAAEAPEISLLPLSGPFNLLTQKKRDFHVNLT